MVWVTFRVWVRINLKVRARVRVWGRFRVGVNSRIAIFSFLHNVKAASAHNTYIRNISIQHILRYMFTPLVCDCQSRYL